MPRSQPTLTPERPSLVDALLAPTTVANFVAGAFMLIGMAYPHSVGPEGLPSWAWQANRFSAGKQVLAIASLWPYALAAWTLTLIAVLTLARPSRTERIMLASTVAFATGLGFVWLIVLFIDSESSRWAMTVAALVAPPATLVSLRVFWLCRLGREASAAAWTQGSLCTLAMFSLQRFWVPQAVSLSIGGWISVAAAGMMLSAAWTWTTATYCYADRRNAESKMQVSLFQLAVAVTIATIAAAYWRALA